MVIPPVPTIIGPRKLLRKALGFIGEMLAFATVFLVIFMLINGRLNFLPYELTDTLIFIAFGGVFFTLTIKALELSLRAGYIITIVLAVLLIVLFVVLLLPGQLPAWIQFGANGYANEYEVCPAVTSALKVSPPYGV